MKRKKQLLALIMSFLLAFTLMPKISVFATDYDLKGNFDWDINKNPSILKVGDIIKDSDDGCTGIKIHYYNDAEAYNSGAKTVKDVILDKGSTHIVLSEKDSGASKSGYKLVDWQVKSVYKSGGYATELYLIGNWIQTFTLNYTSAANGSITGNKTQVVGSGENGTEVTAVADSEYHFIGWSDGVKTATRTDSNVKNNINVTANFAINTYTLTYKAGANGKIIGNTPQTINSGTSGTTVTAEANPGYHFTDWSDGVKTATRTDSNVKNNINVTANFAINTYTLTYTAAANGSITGNTSQTINNGESGATVTAVADSEYHFIGWSDGLKTAARTDKNITADISVTANFAINTYTLTYTAGANGKIIGNTPQTINSGTSGTTVTAEAEPGYHFIGWSDGVKTATRIEKNVTADINVTANFAINTYTLTYKAGANGKITGNTPQTINSGESGTTVTAEAEPGYHFTGWSDGVKTATRIEKNVTADINVTANFAINTYTLTYTAGANGKITGNTPQTINSGTSGTTVTAEADPGYHFTGWSDGVKTAIRTDKNITADISVTANFVVDSKVVEKVTTNNSQTKVLPKTGSIIDSNFLYAMGLVSLVMGTMLVFRRKKEE